MTKLLMSCDDRLFINDGLFYAADKDRYDFYQRYLRVFDTLRLVCRCEEEKELKPNRIPLSKDPRIEVVPIPLFHKPQEYLKVYFEVGYTIKDSLNGCDAAVLRIPSTVALRVGKQVLKKRIPYACEVVFDAEDQWRSIKGFQRFIWKIIDKQTRAICANAEGVSCVTDRYLQQHYFSQKTNSFVANYSSLALPETFYTDKRPFPTHKPIVIAHTANQVEYNGRKGHVELIKALQLLKNKGLNVRIRFAGRNHYGGIEKLKGLSKDLGVDTLVDFVGYLNREELNHFLDNADLFVMPTRAEGLPRVIIEAMAKGLPCITTPVSGNPELIENHFLVPYENINELADRIKELITNPDIYEKTSQVNFERSKQYEASLLQSRRDEFYTKLKKRIGFGI